MSIYRTKEWYKVRAKALQANRRVNGGVMVCAICRTVVVDWANVDHIVTVKDRPDLAFDLSNLQVLHQGCHSSAKQIIDRNKDKVGVGIDGFPPTWS